MQNGRNGLDDISGLNDGNYNIPQSIQGRKEIKVNEDKGRKEFRRRRRRRRRMTGRK